MAEEVVETIGRVSHLSDATIIGRDTRTGGLHGMRAPFVGESVKGA
jgi:hypothetical protein